MSLRTENYKAHPVRRLTGWLKKSGDYSLDGPEASAEDVQFDKTEEHNIITSKAADVFGPVQGTLHYPVLDLDGPVRFVPSSTPGHFHLFIDRECEWYDYVAFLNAAAKIGLIEDGYARASVARGYSSAFMQVY